MRESPRNPKQRRQRIAKTVRIRAKEHQNSQKQQIKVNPMVKIPQRWEKAPVIQNPGGKQSQKTGRLRVHTSELVLGRLGLLRLLRGGCGEGPPWLHGEGGAAQESPGQASAHGHRCKSRVGENNTVVGMQNGAIGEKATVCALHKPSANSGKRMRTKNRRYTPNSSVCAEWTHCQIRNLRNG